MFEYVISYWRDDADCLGIDVQRWETFVDPMFPEGLLLNVPERAERCIISCEQLEFASLCYVAGYIIEAKNGKA